MADVFRPGRGTPLSNAPVREKTVQTAPGERRPVRLQTPSPARPARRRPVEYRFTPGGVFRTPRTINREATQTIVDYYKDQAARSKRGMDPSMLTYNTARILNRAVGLGPGDFSLFKPQVPNSEKYIGSFDMFALMGDPNPDDPKKRVPGAVARLQDVRAFVDSGGRSFGLTKEDTQKMIRQGLMAYVERKGSDVPRPVVVASPVALQQFLSENYKPADKPAKADRDIVEYEKRKPNYTFSDSLEYYQNIYGLNPVSTAFDYDPQRERNIKRTEIKGTQFGYEYPKGTTIDPVTGEAIMPEGQQQKIKEIKTLDTDYTFDFAAMEQKYRKFRETDKVWREKILNEIEDNGGARGLALWNKLLSGKAKTSEIDELKGYMYSFDAKYGDVQRAFLADISGVNFSDIARNIRQEETLKPLRAEAAKRRADEELERLKAVADTRLEYFSSEDPNEIYANALKLIQSGQGEYIPPDVLAKIRTQLSAEEPVDGGSAAEETFGISGTLGDVLDIAIFDRDKKVREARQGVDLLQPKTLNDFKKVDFINNVRRAIVAGEQVNEETVALANEFMNDLGPDGYEAVIQNKDQLQQIQNDTVGFTMGKLAELGSMAPLQPVPADVIKADLNGYEKTKAVRDNLFKSIARYSTTALPGLYALAKDPYEGANAIIEDYKRRYGSTEGFIDSSLEDPLAPILDLLSIVPIAGLATKSIQTAKVLASTTKVSRAGLSARQFARIQRQMIVDDLVDAPAEAGLGGKLASGEPIGPTANNTYFMRQLMAQGEFGELNRLYNVGFIDRAASLFEPRYVVLNASDGMRKSEVSETVDKLAQKFAAEAKNKVYIRYAGNPVSRQFQKLWLGAQVGGAALPVVGPTIANLPYLGFNFRYGKALKEGDPFISDMVNREFSTERQLQYLNEFDLDDAEMAAAWYLASGEVNGNSARIAVLTRRKELSERVKQQADLEGLDPEEFANDALEIAEIDLARYSTPEFDKRYRAAIASVTQDLDDNGAPKSNRARRIAQVVDGLKLLSERNSRLLTSEADPRTLAAFQRAYALVLTASRLLPEDIVAELGKNGVDVLRPRSAPITNPTIRMPELLNMDVADIPVVRTRGKREETSYVDVDQPGARDFLDSVNAGFQTLKADMSTRSGSGAPVLFLADDLPVVELAAKPGPRGGARKPIRYYPMRYLQVDGNFDDSDMSFDRKPLLSDDVVYMPENFFVVSRQGNLKFKPAAEARIDAEVAVANRMHKLFPNARDFSDKISTKGSRGSESFNQLANRNEVISAGLASFQFDVQLAHSASMTGRRMRRAFEEVIEEQAFPITVRDYLNDPENFALIGTGRIFDNIAAARAYASSKNNLDTRQNTEPGTIDEIDLPDGSKQYVVRMSYFDTMAITMAEQRLQRLSDWEDIAPYFIDDTLTQLLDVKGLPDAKKNPEAFGAALSERLQAVGLDNGPNSFVMVIPRATVNRFSETTKRTNSRVGKGFQSLSDLFKTLVIGMNFRYIPQSVIGASTLLMLGRPDLAGPVFASLIAQGARNAARQMRSAKDFSRRKIEGTEKEDMFMLAGLDRWDRIWRTVFPDDYMNDIRLDDMRGRNTRLGNLVTKLDQRGIGGAERLANHRMSRVGGKVLNAVSSFGFILSFAFESSLRSMILTKASMKYPGFKQLVDSDLVTRYLDEVAPNDPFMRDMTRQEAAVRILSDTVDPFTGQGRNPFRDERFLREMRYEADSVVGNYRWFDNSERFIRNYLRPFYAWTRHSFMFNKRLLQDRPITFNTLYNAGNYGYEEILDAGGLPDWMLESIPMAQDLVDLLGLDIKNVNRVNLAGINPTGEFGRTILTAADLTGLGPDMGSFSSGLQGVSPILGGFFAKEQGIDPLTGYKLPQKEQDQSLARYYFDMYTSFPVLAQAVNMFKTETDLNEARMLNSETDIFKNPGDPNDTELVNPWTPSSYKFPTMSRTGLWNMFTPFRALSYDPEYLDKTTRQQWKDAGIVIKSDREMFKSQRTRAIQNLAEWKQLEWLVYNVYLPKYGDNPELRARVLKGLRDAYPSSRQLSGLSTEDVSRVLSGQLRPVGG